MLDTRNSSSPKRDTSLRFLAQPTDVNFGGNVHGGAAMKWLDQAGYVCASMWSGHYCVTAFVGDINFHNPIRVGNIVEVSAQIISTGRTSMHIAVNMYSCDPKQCELTRAIHCIMVFVAVDEDGEAVGIPSWEPIEDADIALEKYAQRILELRKLNHQDPAEIAVNILATVK